MSVDHPVARGKRLELVGRRYERQAGEPCDLFRNLYRELRVRVEPRADRGAPKRELAQVGQRRVDVRETVAELGDVAGELLAQGERGRILKVRAADLDDVRELGRLGMQRAAASTGTVAALSNSQRCSGARPRHERATAWHRLAGMSDEAGDMGQVT